MKQIKIKITKLDIKNGKRRSMTSCPVALAIQRIPGLEKIRVNHTAWKWSDHFFELPIEVQEFIELFDTGNPVKPLSFTLNVP